MGLYERLQASQDRVAHLLKTYLPPMTTAPTHLHEAMHYCLLGGGKRLRAFLAMTTAECFDGNPSQALSIACALECIHAYSLVHDDLPAMDDDALRRGRPTCHLAFDEATAILVGDALQTLAFEILSQPELGMPAATQLGMVAHLSKAASQMVKGQAMDIAYEGCAISIAQLEAMHAAKTGALIEASILLGAMTSDTLSENTLSALKLFAHHIGLAFQIKDDILDVTTATEILGKPAGSDENKHKSTYASLLGVSGAEEKLNMHFSAACLVLETIDAPLDKLKEVAQFIIERVA